MSITSKLKLFRTSLVLGVCLMTTGLAHAAKPTGESHTEAVPTDNKCWGEAASALAKLGMGDHSKSSKTPATTFRDGDFGGDEPRLGVGNVSEDIHGVAPGDGGNGQHAVNNAQFFSTLADPVTGEVFAQPDPSAALLGTAGCSTGLQPNLP
jgi:hypothetical protein